MIVSGQIIGQMLLQKWNKRSERWDSLDLKLIPMWIGFRSINVCLLLLSNLPIMSFFFENPMCGSSDYFEKTLKARSVAFLKLQKKRSSVWSKLKVILRKYNTFLKMETKGYDTIQEYFSICSTSVVRRYVHQWTNRFLFSEIFCLSHIFVCTHNVLLESDLDSAITTLLEQIITPYCSTRMDPLCKTVLRSEIYFKRHSITETNLIFDIYSKEKHFQCCWLTF